MSWHNSGSLTTDNINLENGIAGSIKQNLRYSEQRPCALDFKKKHQLYLCSLLKWLHLCYSGKMPPNLKAQHYRIFFCVSADLESFSHCRLLLQNFSCAILSNAQDKYQHLSAIGELYQKIKRVCVSNCQLLWLTFDRMDNLKIIVADEQEKHLCLWEPLKPLKLQKPTLTHTTVLQYLFNFTQHFQSWLTLLPATCIVFVLRSVGLLHKLFYRDLCADFLRDCLSYLF